MNLDADGIIAKMLSQAGPGPGQGRGPGRRWGGIVEDTPCIWITWIVHACKALGRPVPASFKLDGETLPIVSVQVKYGTRFYFFCRCGCRTEAVFFLRGRWGCRRCLRLGYRSQATRRNSVYRYLDQIWDRRPLLSRRYEDNDNPIVADVVDPLRKKMAAMIDEMFARVTVSDDNAPMEKGEAEHTLPPTPPA